MAVVRHAPERLYLSVKADDLKGLWDSLKAEGSPSDPHDPKRLRRMDAAMAPVYELLRQFQRERDHQPFDSQAPCPLCGGTVTYWYRSPLIGGMKCGTPECVALSL